MKRMAATSWSELEKKLKQARSEALQAASETASDYTKDVVERVVYGAGSPTVYERTYDLKDSIRENPVQGSTRTTATVVIDHDITQISTDLTMYQHGSPQSGSVADVIPEIVHGGLSGDMFGDGYWRRPRPYMDVAAKELSGGKFRQYMVSELKAMGLNAK